MDSNFAKSLSGILTTCPAHHILPAFATFAVESSELVVYSSPPHTVLLHTTRCSNTSNACMSSSSIARSYQRLLHGAFGAGVNLFRPQVVVESSTDDFTANVVVCRY